MDAERRLSRLQTAAEAGGALAREAFREPLTVETKETPLDSVTELDRAVQRRVAEILREGDPGAVVVGEEDLPDVETAESVPETGDAWIVDPIDGTNNFVAGNRNWAVSVAAVVDGEPVAAVNYMPVMGDTYAAADDEVTRNGEPVTVSPKDDPETFTVNPVFGLRAVDKRTLADYVRVVAEEYGDLRRFGCAQLALSAVASGELEAAVSAASLSPWDTVAGVHLVRQAGGRVTDVHGERWTAGSEGLIATNGTRHEDVVDSFDAI